MQAQRASLSILRDAICVALIAVVTMQALRRWVADRYVVPTDSMQPTFYGDPDHGDVVLVDKLASAAACKRYDLVVVLHPTEPGTQLVKRIVASGDDRACWIDIRDGDLWLGENGQSMWREQKNPLLARAMRVPWASWPGAHAASLLDLRAAQVGEGELRVDPIDVGAEASRATFRAPARTARRRSGALTPQGFVGTAAAIDATYIDQTGARSTVGTDAAVNDGGMDFELSAPPDALLATIEARNEALTFHWQPALGRVELWRNGDPVAETALPTTTAAHRVEFGLLDDRVFFFVDGRSDAKFVVARDWPIEVDTEHAPRCHLHLAALGRLPLRVTSLRVFHDVPVVKDRILDLAAKWPRQVLPGHWFLLGDSPFDSRDSRQFGGVSMRAFLGAPRCVLGPWPRGRWLAP